jgi:amino acid transporter
MPTVVGITPDNRLESDAIGVSQDTVIGLANSAPTVSIALTIAALAAATAYGAVPALLICAVPMVIIANAYRRLNMWNTNCGVSFEWVGRTINPYLGFMTGWFVIVAVTVGTAGTVDVLGPSVLAVFNANATNKWWNCLIAVVLCLVMLVIAILGIRLTARTQVGMAIVEYVILLVFATWGLTAVLSHHAGTVPITRSWFSVSGIDGKGSLALGMLTAIFMFSGWEASVYVNEESTRRSINPGRAAITGTLVLAVLYVFSILGLQGAVSSKTLQSAPSPLIAIGQALGGGNWAKVMALAIALSTIATVGTGILLAARITYSMACRRVLPEFLSQVSSRFRTPANTTALCGILLVAVSVLYLLVTSLQNAFTDAVDVTAELAILVYGLTTLATIVYYRRRIFTGVGSALTLGILPLGAIGFLAWVFYKQVATTTTVQKWTLVGIIVVGLLLMLASRVFLRSSFYRVALESDKSAARLRSLTRPPGRRQTDRPVRRGVRPLSSAGQRACRTRGRTPAGAPEPRRAEYGIRGCAAMPIPAGRDFPSPTAREPDASKKGTAAVRC